MISRRFLVVLPAAMLAAGCGDAPDRVQDAPVLGVLLPLSGPEAKAAAALLTGLELGVHHAGEDVRVVARDDAGDAGVAARRWRDLASDSSVLAVVGGWHAATARPVAALAHDAGLPFVALSPLADTGGAGEPRIDSPHRLESAAVAAAAWAREAREAATAGVWSAPDREASMRCGRRFAAEFAARGGEVAWTVAPGEDGRTERPAGAPQPVDVVFVAGSGDRLPELLEFGAGVADADYVFVDGWLPPESSPGGPSLFRFRIAALDTTAADWSAFASACAAAGIDAGPDAARGWDVGRRLAGLLAAAEGDRSLAARGLRAMPAHVGVTGALGLGRGVESVAVFALEAGGERPIGRVEARPDRGKP